MSSTEITGCGRKRKTPLIILKKLAPKKKGNIKTGKLKAIPTSQAEKIAKAVASLIPRPKGKKKSTIESRMIKLKKESLIPTSEEYVSRLLAKEELKAEKEELKKPRKKRSDDGTHKPKWYLKQGKKIPDDVKARYPKTKYPHLYEDEPIPASRPKPKPVMEIDIESKPKTKSEKKEYKSEGRKPEADKPVPSPLTTYIDLIPAPAPSVPASSKPKSKKIALPPIKKLGILETLALPYVKPVIVKPAPKKPVFKKHPPVKPKEPETDEASSGSESSIFSSSGEGLLKGSGADMTVKAPKKNASARGQKGL